MSSEPARAVDSVMAFQRGVDDFCAAHREEIFAYIANQFTADIRMMLAELVAIRAGKETACTITK